MAYPCWRIRRTGKRIFLDFRKTNGDHSSDKAAGSPAAALAIYGAGKLRNYLLERHPKFVKLVRCIIDDDSGKWETDINGDHEDLQNIMREIVRRGG